MATIRKRKGKYEVQIRRTGQPHVSRTFIERKDARQWARQMEIAADRNDLPTTVDRRKMAVTLGALVGRYRDTVTVHKRGGKIERVVLNNFVLHPICRKTISELRTSDFAEYRDERLREVSPVTLKRQLNPIHHLFEIARDEWGVPLKKNPLAKLKLEAPDQRRERRLRAGELDRLLLEAGKCRGRSRLIGPIIAFAVETGMRRGEILAITDADREAKNPHTLSTKLSTTRFSPTLSDAMVSSLCGNRRTRPTQLISRLDERLRPRGKAYFSDMRTMAKRNALKLRIELVPERLWGINLRSKAGLGKWRWTKLRRELLATKGDACTICGSTRKPHGHEVWAYQDRPRKSIARLLRVEVICQTCHLINHWGRTGQLIALGIIDHDGHLALRRHFRRVNRCKQRDLDRHIEISFAVWAKRSRRKWKVEWGDFSPVIKPDWFQIDRGTMDAAIACIDTLAKSIFEWEERNASTDCNAAYRGKPYGDYLQDTDFVTMGHVFENDDGSVEYMTHDLPSDY